jgi:uncharacterized protein
MPLRLLVCVALLCGLATAHRVHAGTDEATTSLATAIVSNDSPAFDLALAGGAFVNADLGAGSTPLLEAVAHSRLEMVKVLLEHGANANARADDPSVGNAVSAAAVAVTDAADHAAALEVLRLVAHADGVDLNVLVRRHGTLKSALMMAAEVGASDAIEVLLDAGADVNATDGGGYTALDYAVDHADDGVVRLLFEKGARSGSRKT